MKYAHIVNYVSSSAWAILPEKMAELLSVLAFRAAGHTFSAEEIRARIGDPADSPTADTRGGVTVIPLRGVIAHRMGTLDESSGGMSAERFTRMIQSATADDSVGTIVLDVDSPGGTVAGLVEAADAVFEARKKKRVMAVANATMASAAYWIASQASEIVAIPSALDMSIGSIGVFTVHQDLSAALEREGIKVTLIKSGEHKAEGNPFEPLSNDVRAQLQASVDAAKDTFVKTVARGRDISPADVVSRYGDGRAFNAKDALKAGIIDRIATFDEVLGRAASRRTARMRAEGDDVRMRAAGW